MKNRPEARINPRMAALFLCAAGVFLLGGPVLGQTPTPTPTPVPGSDRTEAQLHPPNPQTIPQEPPGLYNEAVYAWNQALADWNGAHMREIFHYYVDDEGLLQRWKSRYYIVEKPNNAILSHARTAAGQFLYHRHHYMEFGTTTPSVLGTQIDLPPTAAQVDAYYDALFIFGDPPRAQRIQSAKAQHQTCYEYALTNSPHATGAYDYELHIGEGGTPNHIELALESDLVVGTDGARQVEFSGPAGSGNAWIHGYVMVGDILHYRPSLAQHVSLVMEVRPIEGGDEIPDDGDELPEGGEEIPEDEEGEGGGDEIPDEQDQPAPRPPAVPKRIQWKWMSSGVYTYLSPSGAVFPPNDQSPYRTPYQSRVGEWLIGQPMSVQGLVERNLNAAEVRTKRAGPEN